MQTLTFQDLQHVSGAASGFETFQHCLDVNYQLRDYAAHNEGFAKGISSALLAGSVVVVGGVGLLSASLTAVAVYGGIAAVGAGSIAYTHFYHTSPVWDIR